MGVTFRDISPIVDRQMEAGLRGLVQRFELGALMSTWSVRWFPYNSNSI